MGVVWRVRGCLLTLIVMASGLSAQDKPQGEAVQLRIFDVRDLTYPFPDFPRKGSVASNDYPHQRFTGEDLANLTKFCVDRGKWDENDGQSIAFDNGLLLIRNTPGTLDSVERFLSQVREMASVQQFFEIRILTVPISELAALPSSGILSAKDTEALCRDSERARWVSALLTAVVPEGQRVAAESGSLRPLKGEAGDLGVYAKAELYSVWAPERGTILELQLEVLRSPLKGGGPARVGEVCTTFALPTGGGCVLALGESEGALYYAVVRGRTVAPARRGRVLDFTPGAGAGAHLALVPVEDLVPPLRDFVGLPFFFGEGVRGADPVAPLLTFDHIVDLVKDSTSKIGDWQGAHTIEKTPTAQLLINNTPETLAAVNKALSDLWTLTMPPSLTTRLTAIEVDDATLAQLRDAGGTGFFPIPFGRDDRSRILESLAGGRVVEDVSVTCYPSQRAFVSARPAAAGTGEAASGETKPRAPLLRTVLDVRCLPLGGKKECLLELRADLGRPGPAAGEEEAGESWRLTATVPLGGGLVLGAHPATAAKKWRVCLLSCSNDR